MSIARTHAFAQRQRGLSLIELMISITLGLIILSALSTLFLSQSKARTELDKSNRMIDNGRYALEVLSDNLKLAGFYGVLDSGSIALPGALPDPCSTNMANIATALPLHIQGYNAATATVAATTPPACLPATLKPGSDILVVRRVDTSAAIAQAVAVAGTPYLQTRVCQYDPATPGYILDNNPANFTLHQMNCPFGIVSATGPYTSLRRMMVQIYFIDSNNQAGDGIPTLKRLELDATGAFITTPLVEGIEYMQVDYGLENKALIDGSPDIYTMTPALADWPNIMAVRLNIVARNVDPTMGYTDTKTYSLGLAGNAGPFNAAPYNAAPNPVVYPKLENYKRHAYTQVVRLVNPSGRRAP